MKRANAVKIFAALVLLSLWASALDIRLEKKVFYPGDVIRVSVYAEGRASNSTTYLIECTLRSENKSFVPRTSAKKAALNKALAANVNFSFTVLESFPYGNYFLEAKLRDPSGVLENASTQLSISGVKQPITSTTQRAPVGPGEKEGEKSYGGGEESSYLISVAGILVVAMGVFLVVMLIKYRKLSRDKGMLEDRIDVQTAKEKVVDLGLNLIQMENEKIRMEEKKLDEDVGAISHEWNEIENEESRWEQKEEDIMAQEIDHAELKKEEALATRIVDRGLSASRKRNIDSIRLERDVEGIKREIRELEALKTERDEYLHKIRGERMRIDGELRKLEGQKDVLKKEMEAIYRDPQEVRKAEARIAAYHRRIEREKSGLAEEKARMEREEKKAEQDRKKMESDLSEIRMLWEELQDEIGGGKGER